MVQIRKTRLCLGRYAKPGEALGAGFVGAESTAPHRLRLLISSSANSCVPEESGSPERTAAEE